MRQVARMKVLVIILKVKIKRILVRVIKKNLQIQLHSSV